jgi:hypothetical protein
MAGLSTETGANEAGGLDVIEATIETLGWDRRSTGRLEHEDSADPGCSGQQIGLNWSSTGSESSRTSTSWMAAALMPTIIGASSEPDRRARADALSLLAELKARLLVRRLHPALGRR